VLAGGDHSGLIARTGHVVGFALVVLPFVALAIYLGHVRRDITELVRAGQGPLRPQPRSRRATRTADRPAGRVAEHPAGSGTALTSGADNGSAADFTEAVMLRPRIRRPQHGWRRFVHRATGGVVNPGPSRVERERRELLAAVRLPLRASRRIAVLSRKGGAGKTTTVLMLGHAFAVHRGDRVVALDANPDAGSLGYRVPRETTRTITDLLQNREHIGRYSQIRRHTSQAATRLEVLASDDDPRISSRLGEYEHRVAIDLLDRYYNLILIDTGTGVLNGTVQGVLREADQLVVVMPPALDGARVAASTLDWLDGHGHEALVRSAVAVINAVQDQDHVELARVEEHFARRCAAVVRVPWDPALAAGAATLLDDLRPATRTAYLRLASAVVAQFGTSSPRA
jgi:putative peptide zinc metalloprotease protein